MIFSTQPRLFISAECLGCNTVFTRDTRLMEHLAQQKECMHAMGGNVQAARKLVKKMKDKQRNKSGTRKQKYQENKLEEKLARRKRYEDNPSPERQARRQRYEDNPSPERQAKREKYKDNPSPVRQARRQRYEDNPSPERQSRRQRYEDNPSPERQARRKRYEDNPSPEKQAQRERYHNDTGSLEDGFSRFVASGRYGPSYPCVVCHELHWQGGMRVVTLNDFDARYICRDYILENKCLFLKQDNYHCCKTCKRKVEAGLMPSVAAKNNLQCPWDTVPRELLKLNEVILCFLLFPI
jgi:hypothetical protein